MRRNVLIIGASGSLGRRTAETFTDDDLYLCDIKKPQYSLANGSFIECNVCDSQSVKKLSEYLTGKDIKIDILIYSAGIYRRGKIEEVEQDQWIQSMDVNVNGLYRVLHKLIPQMNEGARIIAVASQFGLVGTYESVSYCASKAAMVNLIRCVALDDAKQKIRANCVCPGFFESPFLYEVERNTKMKREWMSVMGMLPKSKVNIEDIVGAIKMLSENSSITGQCIVVDGGYTAR